MSESFINESVMATPQPRASSTVAKKDPIRKVDRDFEPIKMNYSSFDDEQSSNAMSTNSLGILNMDEVDASIYTEVFDRLKEQRQLAASSLERAANKVAGLPSKYFKSDSPFQKTNTILYPNDSTVNESDLIKRDSVHSQSFNPNNVSTPRNSDLPEKSLENLDKSLYDHISEMSGKLRNSDISIQDLCLELTRNSIGKTSTPLTGAVESQIFTPAELMSEKFMKDEQSWRREKDIPVESFRSNLTNTSSYQEKLSVGDFFKCRSNDIGDMFSGGGSPEKKQGPIPLIDVTNTVDNIDESRATNVGAEPESSLMSVSQIAKVLSDFSTDTPSKILDYLSSKNKNKNFCADTSKLSMASSKENDCDEYLKAQQQERSSRSSSRTSTDIRKKSKSPIQRTPAIRRSSSIYGRKSPLLRDSLEVNPTKPKTSPNGSNSFEFLAPNAQSSSRFSTGKKSSDYDSSKTSSSTLKEDTNKENISQDRSLSSVRCPSSLDSLPEGKLPIKGNRTELVWGCVKLGKRSVQDFCIRNQLNQKIRLQVTVSGSYFRIVRNRDDTEMSTSMIFMLHPLETKAMSVMFSPTTVGAASEKLTFLPVNKGETNVSMKQTIMLYGYGGHASMDVSKVAKDAHSKLWLSLGALDRQRVIRQEFTMKNNGILPAFALLTVTSHGISNETNLKLQPTEFVLKPQQEITVFITYITSKEDYRFSQDILDVGCIKLITGPEAIRGRLRRISGILTKKKETVDPIVLRLTKEFAEEMIPVDIKLCRESVASTKDLLANLTIKEIRVTVEKDPDLTIVPNGEFDDTSLYQTLGLDATVISADISVQSMKRSVFKVEPNIILLSLPFKREDTIILHSECDRAMPFEVVVEPDCFEVRPSIGSVEPGEMLVLNVRCLRVPAAGTGNGKVSVYVENEVMEVVVKTVVFKGKK